MKKLFIFIAVLLLSKTYSQYDWAPIPAPNDTIPAGFSFFIDLANMSSDFKTNWTADGAHFKVFLKNSGDSLAYDIITSNHTAGTGVMRVLFPDTVFLTGNDTVCIIPADSANGEYSVSSTYGRYNAYVATEEGHYPIYCDTASPITDRTSHLENGTWSDADITIASNKLNFTNTHNGVALMGSRPLDGAAAVTISAVINFSSGIDDRGIFYIDNHAVARPLWFWVDIAGSVNTIGSYFTTSDTINGTGALLGSTTVVINTNYHVVLTYNGSKVRLYINGKEEGGVYPRNLTGTLKNGLDNRYIFGNDSLGAKNFRGTMNNMRILTSAVDSAWADYEYRQLNNNSTFWGTWTWQVPSDDCNEAPTHLNYDTTYSTIIDSVTVGCDGDNYVMYLASDTLDAGTFDSANFIAVTNGDTLSHTFTGLTASTKYFLWSCDSGTCGTKLVVYTADYEDTIYDTVCTPLTIDSIVGPDSVQVGGNIVLDLTEGKSAGQTATVGGVSATIDYQTDTLDTIICPSVSVGLRWVKIGDSCGYYDSVQIMVWAPSPPPVYTVYVSVTNGTSDQSGANSVDSNVQFMITHAPNLHYHLTAITITGTADTIWTSATEFRITPHSNATVAITYGIDTFTLTEVPPTNGTITYSPNAGGSSPRYYPHNTRVTVTATADPGYVFRGWGGAISSTTPVDSFLMVDHLPISATFEALPTTANQRRNGWIWSYRNRWRGFR